MSSSPDLAAAGVPSLRRQILITWGLAVVLLLIACGGKIWHLQFHDPDDAMRLLEVRDWIAGQSFWDVSQHRLGGGNVFQMHWSRLVDIPLAAIILVLTPFTGADVAAKAAMVIAPLGQLLIVMSLIAATTRRLAGRESAATALLIVPITVPLLAQLQPMRIDHHGWQVVCALAATYALIRGSDWRSGALAGLAAAALITISMEGFPFAAAIVGVAALAWVFDPGRAAQARTAAVALFGGSLALHLATRGPGVLAPACDAVSPAWLAMLAVAALGVALATMIRSASVAMRLLPLGLIAVASLGTLLMLAPDCARGPFAILDPLTRTVWFLNIAEGLPFWTQKPILLVINHTLPLVGIAGAAWALASAPQDRAAGWRLMLALQLIAYALGLMVLRASATANALAVPGTAVIVTMLLQRARAEERLFPRLWRTVIALMVAAPGLFLLAVFTPLSRKDQVSTMLPACITGAEVAQLGQLPPSRLFAPLDIGPEILTRTRHNAIASGYHRNVRMMHDVLETFLASPQTAYANVKRYDARYVVACPGLGETEIYKRLAPNGFWARLERGEHFDWLEPVPIRDSPVRAWRVL